nr:ribonuclease H-like domain-containing protein [Tanacetum cinerariifolium]
MTRSDKLLFKLLGRLGVSPNSNKPSDEQPTQHAIDSATVAHVTSTATQSNVGPTTLSGQATNLPYAFSTVTLQDLASGAWNMDTGASSHLNNTFNSLSEIFNTCITRDLYPVTAPSLIHHAFLVSQHMWHQRLGHLRGEVLRRLASSNFISYNIEKPPVLCHAFQLGKHVRLSFVSSSTVIGSCFDIIHSDEWTHSESFRFVFISEEVSEILERAHMVNCNPSRTPIDTESKLGDGGDPVSDPTLYQSLAGSMQYLTFTRLDISYVVQQGTMDYGLWLFSSSTTDLVAYSDADWAGCPTTREIDFRRGSIVVLSMLLLRLVGYAIYYTLPDISSNVVDTYQILPDISSNVVDRSILFGSYY